MQWQTVLERRSDLVRNRIKLHKPISNFHMSLCSSLQKLKFVPSFVEGRSSQSSECIFARPRRTPGHPLPPDDLCVYVDVCGAIPPPLTRDISGRITVPIAAMGFVGTRADQILYIDLCFS